MCKKDFDSQNVLVTRDVENCRIDTTAPVCTATKSNTGTVDGVTVTVTGSDPESGIVSVTNIGYGAFYNNRLTSVTLPSSVTNIGSYAFAHNQLTSVVIPSSVTSMGDYAFYNNQLTSVVIPSSVTNIGSYAFRDNQLTSVTIPSSVTSMGELAFSYNQLTSVTLPSSVKNIGSGAFNVNQLPDNQAFIYARKTDGSEDKTKIVSYGGAKKDNIIIPSSVTSMGDYAFYNNQLTSVVIPSSVTNIGSYAFDFNQLTSVVIPSSVTLSDYSISPSFYTSYVTNNNKSGGTYTAPSQNGVWTKQ